MNEIWKQVKGFSNYEVSNFGNVRSVISKKLLHPYSSKLREGYCYISLQQNGKRKNYLLSQLIARHFIDNPLNKPQVNHKSGNKLDNSVSNLEWVTAKENIQHAIRNGWMAEPLYGSKSPAHKVDEKQVMEIRKLEKEGMRHKDIAKIYGLGVSTVTHIVNGTRWAWFNRQLLEEKL